MNIVCGSKKKVNSNYYEHIEKWLFKECDCDNCLQISEKLNKYISGFQLLKLGKNTNEKINLTSKTIIKIQIELIKAKMKKSL